MKPYLSTSNHLVVYTNSTADVAFFNEAGDAKDGLSALKFCSSLFILLLILL